MLRSLPWGSLILADLLVTLIVVAGLVVLIIPGLIALTLLAVVGPVIELERRRPWPACAVPPIWSGLTSGGSRRLRPCRWWWPTGWWASCRIRLATPTS